MKADLRLLSQRVAKMPLDNTMMTLINDEVLGIVDGVIDAVIEKNKAVAEQIDELGEMMVSIIEDTDDIIHAELSAQIIKTLMLGSAICQLLEGVTLDDLTKKKLQDAIHEYQRQAIVTTEAVLEVTIEDDEDGEGDFDDDDKTPVEIPNPLPKKKEDDDDGDDSGDAGGDPKEDEEEAEG